MTRLLAPLLALTALLGAALWCESSPPAAQLAQSEGTAEAGPSAPEATPPPVAQDPDALPEGALRRLGTRAFAHAQSIHAVAWGGERVATASNGELRVWEAGTGDLLMALATPVAYLALSPDGETLATSPAHTREVRLWRVGEERPRHTLVAGLRHVTALAFSPDGARLAAACSIGEVDVFDVTDGRRVAELSLGRRWPSAVAFAPDGGRVAVGTRDGALAVFDASGGDALLALDSLVDRIAAVAFAPGGQLLAVGGLESGTVVLYDLRTGALWATLEGHQGPVTALSFTPSGDALVSLGLDWTVRRWDVDSATEQTPRLRLRDAGGVVRWAVAAAPAELPEVPRLALAPDGGAVAVAGYDHALIRRAFEGDGPPRPPSGRVTALTFTDDGARVLAGGEDGGVAVWDVVGGGLTEVLRAPDEAVATLTVEGTHLRARTGWSERIWDLGTGRLVSVTGGRFSAPRALLFDDGGRLALGDYGRVVVIDPHTGVEERVLVTDPRSFVALAAPGDGTLVALGRAALGDELFDVQEGRHLRALDVRDQRVLSLSRDGSTLAGLARSGVVTIWQVGAPEPLVRYEPRRRVERLALSPDGSWLAGGERGDLILWEVGGASTRQPAYAGHITSLSWSADGTHLAAAGTHQLMVYELASGSGAVRVSEAYDAVALSADGSVVAGLDDTGVIAIWEHGDVEPDRLLDTEASEGQGMTSAAPDLAFSPDDRLLAALDRFNQLTVWDLEEGALVLRLGDGTVEPTAPRLRASTADGRLRAQVAADGAIEVVTGGVLGGAPRGRFEPGAPVTSLAFSPDGRVLASGSDDTTVLLWPLEPPAAPTPAPPP